MIDYIKLQEEITNDPTNLGYSGKSDQEKADLGNTLVSGILPISSLTRDSVLKIILPAVQVMANSGTLQTKWNPLLTLIGGATNIENDAEFQGTMSALINDFESLNPGMSQNRVDSYSKRKVSRFEEAGIFDSTTTTQQFISERDIGIARNGH